MPAKRRRLGDSSPYDPLPVDKCDLDECFGFHQFGKRYVAKTSSTEWGPPSVAVIRAIHTVNITPENEKLVRTYHPSLCDYDEVCVSDVQYGAEVWLVRGGTTDIEAGGRAIHLHPGEFLKLISLPQSIMIRHAMPEEWLFQTGINPRKLLSSSQLDSFRELFPTAVGVRILVSGFIVVLFKSKPDLQAAYRHDWITEIGGLRAVYDTLSVDVAVEPISSGMQVSQSPGSIVNVSGCLGLRLRLTDGTQAITTVTHGFVRDPWWSLFPLRVAEWAMKAKRAFRRLVRSPAPSETSAVAIMDNSGNNSPIGKQVWLATKSVRVGTITHTFDTPSAILPYPAGYTHDLSLVTDENLPTIVSPREYPVISEWTTYSNALSGCSVYAARQNVVVGRWATPYGTIDPDAFRAATVCGADYLWDREARSQTAALLWNTLDPLTPAIGWSGSVLCVGQPTDTFSRAVVFQNYQVAVRANEKTVILKAGFLLPKAIKVATIVTNPEDSRPRESNTFPRQREQGHYTDSRVFSA